MNHRMPVTILSCLFSIGCDPGVTVSGHVVDAANTPLSGADVSFSCDDGRYEGSQSTDENGDFSIDGGTGCVSNDCIISISSKEITEEFRVGEHCEMRAICRKSCAGVYIDAQLK